MLDIPDLEISFASQTSDGKGVECDFGLKMIPAFESKYETRCYTGQETWVGVAQDIVNVNPTKISEREKWV